MRLFKYHSIGIVLATMSLLALIFNSCNNSTGPVTDSNQPLPALTISWTQSNSIVCFGTSLTYGYRYYYRPGFGLPLKSNFQSGDTLPGYLKDYFEKLLSLSFNVDSSYPSFLAARLKIRVENQGYVGAKISRGLQLVTDSVLSKKPVLVLLEFGANDMLQGVKSDTAEAQLNRLVKIIQDYGSQVVLISFINPDMANHLPADSPLLLFKDTAQAYYAMLNRVAQKNSIEIVEYPLKGIFAVPSYMSDLIHPNGLGYKMMEENISAALSATYTKNGMLK